MRFLQVLLCALPVVISGFLVPGEAADDDAASQCGRVAALADAPMRDLIDRPTDDHLSAHLRQIELARTPCTWDRAAALAQGMSPEFSQSQRAARSSPSAAVFPLRI